MRNHNLQAHGHGPGAAPPAVTVIAREPRDLRLPLYFAVGLLCGVMLTGAASGVAPSAGLLAAVVAAACAAAPAVTCSRLRRPRRALVPAALAAGCAASLLVSVSPADRAAAVELVARGQTLTGYLMEDAAGYADSATRYRVRLERVAWHGVETDAAGVLTVVLTGGPELSAGSRVVLRYQPESVWQSGRVTGVRAQSITVVGFRRPHLAWRDRIRRELLVRIEGMGYRPGGLFRALVMGSRARLSRGQQQLFRESGSSHLLALSGMHLGIVAAVSYAMVRLFLGKRSAFVVTLAACLGYIYLVGARPSLLRAMAMFALGGSLRLAGRRVEPLNLVAAAACALVLLMPPLLYQLSFQLSVLAIGGIVGPGARVRRLLAPYLPPALAVPLAAAVGAQLTTALPSLWVFGAVYPVAVLSSVLLVPLVTLFVWSGLAWLLPVTVGLPVPSALLLLPEQARLIHRLAGAFAQLPAPPVGPLTSAVTVVAVALVVALLYGRDVALRLDRHRRRGRRL